MEINNELFLSLKLSESPKQRVEIFHYLKKETYLRVSEIAFSSSDLVRATGFNKQSYSLHHVRNICVKTVI